MTNRQGLLILPTIIAAACAAPSGEPASEEHAAVATVSRVPQSPNPYTLFETLQVRPLALSADGKTLFATNTPDNRLEIFRVTEDGLKPAGSVLVGLEPISVAVRSPTEVWVVNHLSDSVSVVTLDGDGPRVSRTLLVGDEPR